MQLLDFQDGTELFRTGDPCDRAFLIRAGAVRLTPGPEDHAAAERVAGPGEIVGATGLLTTAERRETAATVGDTRLVVIGRDELATALDTDQGIAEAAIRTLALSAAPETDPPADLTADAPVDVPVDVPIETPAMRLFPDGERIARQLPKSGIDVSSLPFTIGRANPRHDNANDPAPDLALNDRRPYHISRLHFAIRMTEDGPVIQDVGSYHGTWVNGERIGARHGRPPLAILQPGENRIVAGRGRTPFRFILMLGETGRS